MSQGRCKWWLVVVCHVICLLCTWYSSVCGTGTICHVGVMCNVEFVCEETRKARFGGKKAHAS